MPRPGVMIYFNAIPALSYLSYEQKGMLFEAILQYAQSGNEPDFQDPMLGMVWSLIKGGIDKDGEEYEKKVAVKKYAVYCREVKKQGNEPISLDMWLELPGCERRRLLVGVSPDNT